MRFPARALVDNLVWSVDGGVWVVWRVGSTGGDPDGGVGEALRTLAADAAVLSVCERIDPMEVAARMADGIDLTRRAAWRAACRTAAEWMIDVPGHRRRTYLVAELPGTRRRLWWDVLRDAAADVAEVFGVPPAPVSSAEVGFRQEQAEAMRAQLASALELHPVTAGELCWLYAHQVRRGGIEPVLDGTWEPRSTNGGAPLQAYLADAVMSDDPTPSRLGPHLRFDTPDGTGYQALLALGDQPHVVDPGLSGLLGDVHEVDFPVDWCVRTHPLPAPGRASSDLGVTTVLAVAAAGRPELEERTAAVLDRFGATGFGVARPISHQADLWRATLPGAAAGPACRLYAQPMASASLDLDGPVRDGSVGSARGVLVGRRCGGAAMPVFLDPDPTRHVGLGTSVAVVGGPGVGKTHLLKRLCWDALARGAQVVVLDRSADGEYAHAAGAMPGRAQVVQGVFTPDAALAGSLDADLVVLWAPTAAQAVLLALLTTLRQLVLRDPGRLSAGLCDDAGGLLSSGPTCELLVDTARDAASRNATLWLAGEHPADFAHPAWPRLAASRFCFVDPARDIDAARFLGFDHSVDEDEPDGVPDEPVVGECLHRDPRGRLAWIDVVPIPVPESPSVQLAPAETRALTDGGARALEVG